MEPAERLSRLYAALIDYAVIIVIGIVAGLVMPLAHEPPMKVAAGLFTAALMFGYLGYQINLLATAGQTIGKRALGLRIVLAKDDSNGGFVPNVLLRGLVPSIIMAIPYLGRLGLIADILFIFRDDRRCLHDHIAGTRVVKA